jgi:hypothetical protein
MGPNRYESILNDDFLIHEISPGVNLVCDLSLVKDTQIIIKRYLNKGVYSSAIQKDLPNPSLPRFH